MSIWSIPEVADPINFILVPANNNLSTLTVDLTSNTSASFILEFFISEELKNINSTASKPFKREIISCIDLIPLSTTTFIN